MIALTVGDRVRHVRTRGRGRVTRLRADAPRVAFVQWEGRDRATATVKTLIEKVVL